MKIPKHPSQFIDASFFVFLTNSKLNFDYYSARRIRVASSWNGGQFEIWKNLARFLKLEEIHNVGSFLGPSTDFCFNYLVICDIVSYNM